MTGNLWSAAIEVGATQTRTADAAGPAEDGRGYSLSGLARTGRASACRFRCRSEATLPPPFPTSRADRQDFKPLLSRHISGSVRTAVSYLRCNCTHQLSLCAVVPSASYPFDRTLKLRVGYSISFRAVFLGREVFNQKRLLHPCIPAWCKLFAPTMLFTLNLEGE